jgi:hypothetical protein
VGWVIPEDQEDEDNQDILVMMQSMLSMNSYQFTGPEAPLI